MNFSQMKQAQQMKSRMDKIKKEMEKVIVEVNVGNNAVKVTINGAQKVLSIKLAPQAVNPDKIKSLEDMITKGVNEAIEKSQKAAAKEFQSMAGDMGINLPGMGK